MPPLTRRAFLAAALALSALPPSAQAETKTFDIAIKGGRVTGAKSLRVTQGDTVILRWTSDKAVALHLHGYDVETKVEPGKPAEMTIIARATGRFPVEVHAPEAGKGGHGHAALFHLEVYPK
jgi:FtsP/CotA-like multicopper oxidase with cupredoxin domain